MKNTDWLRNSAISTAEIARRVNISRSSFSKKLNNQPLNKDRPGIAAFTPEELARLEKVREGLIEELK